MQRVCIPKIVSVLPLAELSRACMKDYYTIVFKEKPCLQKAGCKCCDFRDGTMSFYKPACKEPANLRDNTRHCLPNHDEGSGGWALMFSPELLECEEANWKPEYFSFFSYFYKESLHVSSREHDNIEKLMKEIREEADLCQDKYSCRIVLKKIELLLIYCKRYYERQFQTRSEACSCTKGKVEHAIDAYIKENRNASPTPQAEKRIADEMQMSTAYLKDYIEFENGYSLGEYMQMRQMAMAREMLADGRKDAAKISRILGFSSRQQFCRMFQYVYGVPPGNN